MQRIILALALVVVPCLARAASPTPVHKLHSLDTLLDEIALNAAAATRTFEFDNPYGDYAIAVLEMSRTRVAGTDLTMTCEASRNGTTYAKIQRCAYGATDGICTHYDITWTSGTSTTEILLWEINVLGKRKIKCVVASTSAGATDLLTVTGDLVTQ